MITIEFLNSPVARALGWTLLHTLWQGFALVLPTAIMLHLLRHQSSSLRYRIGTLALFAQLLLSAVTFAQYYQPTTATNRIATTVAALPLRWSISDQSLPWSQQVLLFLEAHLSDFVCLYLIGVSLFGLRLAGGWLHLHQLRRLAVVSPVLAEQTMIDRLRAALNLRTVVLVRESTRVASPMIIGVLKPMLLLPAGLATGLSPRELEAVLAHELAHVKRYDYAVNLLQSVIEMLYFFHPALWWLSARVREEREHCCDDMAVQICGDKGRALAKALARIEERRLEQAGTPALAMAFAGKRQLLLHRVQRVLGLSTRSMVSNRSLAGLTLATLLLVSASVYAIQRQDKAQQSKPKSPAPAVRRSTPSSAIELHFDGNRKLTYVLWKGQKLAVTRVSDLQRKWEQIMSGQVNLDDVAQPDRDILLNVIESQYGKISSSDQAKYEAVADAALADIPLSANGALEGVAVNISADTIMPETPISSSADTSDLKAVQEQLESLGKKMQAIISERQPLVDQMSKELTVLAQQHNSKQKVAQKIMQQQHQLAVQQSLLAMKQLKLSRQLQPLQADIDRLSVRNSKEAKALLTQKRRLQEQLEKNMDELGSKMGKLGDEMGVLGDKMESQLSPYQQRMAVLSDSISKLYEPTYALSDKIAELSSQLAEEANQRAEKAMEMANRALEMNLPLTITSGPARRSSTKHRVINGIIVPDVPVPPAIEPRPARPARPVPPLIKALPATPARPATPPRAIKGKAVILAPAAPPKG